MRRTSLSAFTLIELLVVVAIIAVLIAILLPSLGRAKMNAVRTKCGAQLRGWGQAVQTYTMENSGFFGPKPGSYYGGQWDQDPAAYGLGPPSPSGLMAMPAGSDPLNPTLTGTIGPSVYGQQMGHVMGSKLRFCPADTQAPLGAANVYYYANRPLASYKFAGYLPPPGSAVTARYTVVNISLFKDLGNKLLMCDSHSQNNYGDLVSVIQHNGHQSIPVALVNSGGEIAPRSVGGGSWDTQAELKDRHNGSGNVLFLDYHVETYGWADYVRNIPAIETDPDMSKKWTRMDTN